jgi:putative MFS transporter
VAALDPYQRRLFALLSLATFFEGFDTMLASLMLPQLGAEFGASQAELFDTLATLGLGALFGFVPLRFADRFGRRPLLLVSIGCYTVLCLATAATRTLGEFTFCQFFARMFMVTEVALAYVVLSEEMPAERRGRLNGMLGAFASAGAVVPALLLPASIDLGFGWRGLYAAGGALVVLLPLYVAWLREPRAFQDLPARSLATEWRDVKSLVGVRHRRRFVAAACVWLSIDFWNSCAMFSFSFYVQTERGWTPDDLALWIPLGGVLQFFGYIAAGRLMDRYGRRPTVLLVLPLASAASALCYLAQGPLVVVGYFAMLSLGGMWALAQTISAELFPTEIRATAGGITHNLIGRLGMTLGPKSVGLLAATLESTGEAVALLGLLNLLAIPIIAKTLPETAGSELTN